MPEHYQSTNNSKMQGGGGGQGREITQTMYAHVNK
jgi:hypothetical protein